jgi:hypothetical protein
MSLLAGDTREASCFHVNARIRECFPTSMVKTHFLCASLAVHYEDKGVFVVAMFHKRQCCSHTPPVVIQ